MPKIGARVTKPGRWMGLDPGVKGGAVVLEPNGVVRSIEFEKLTLKEIWEFISWGASFAILEKVSSSPQMGVASSFTFGKGYGNLQGMLTAAKIPYREETPQVWQGLLRIPKRGKKEDKGKFKRRLKSVAERMYPEVEITLGNADALLIATYCKITELKSA